jgi:hypothetical protein
MKDEQGVSEHDVAEIGPSNRRTNEGGRIGSIQNRAGVFLISPVLLSHH